MKKPIITYLLIKSVSFRMMEYYYSRHRGIKTMSFLLLFKLAKMTYLVYCFLVVLVCDWKIFAIHMPTASTKSSVLNLRCFSTRRIINSLETFHARPVLLIFSLYSLLDIYIYKTLGPKLKINFNFRAWIRMLKLNNCFNFCA